VLISITVALGDHGFQTPLGVPLATVVKALDAAAPDALGLNCSLEARKLVGAVRALRELTSLPLLVQPQASEPSVGCKGELRGDDPPRFARDVLKLAEEGVDAVGGCCGATPAHIAALRRALDDRYA
jgi:methionine synthase I (cobalamin-dependent)